MASTASDWTIYVGGVGDNSCQMTPLECGDIGEVTDNRGGTLQTEGFRQTHNNRIAETYRFRTHEPSTSYLLVTEDVAAFLDELRDGDCVTSLQRRRCVTGTCCDWDIIEHYSRVQVSAIQKSGLTASGLNVVDGTPSVIAPFIFNGRSVITNTPASHIDGGGADARLEDTVISVTYCDCQACGTGKCATLFRLKSGGEISYSTDGGETWTVIALCLSASNASEIVCVNGRLIAALGNGHVYYSDSPTGSWELSSGIAGNVSRIRFHGHNIYALSSDVNGRSYVYASIDGARTWQQVLDAGLTPLVDVDVAGSVIVAVGRSGAMYSSQDKGRTWSLTTESVPGALKPDIIAVSLSLTDFRKSDSATAVIADEQNNIYRGNTGSWRRIYAGSRHGASSQEGSRAYLETRLDGNIVWWCREVGGEAIVLKNAGDCTCWKTYSGTVSTGMCSDDNIPPDTYALGCVIDGKVQSIMRCASQEIPCVDAPLFGCSHQGTTYVMRCDDDCEAAYVSIIDDCTNCDECDPDCPTEGCGCAGCVNCLAETNIDEQCIADLVEFVNCAAGCEALTIEDFGYLVQCDQTALVGIGCIDANTVGVYETTCGAAVVFAVCPHDPNVAISIGTEALYSV